MLFDHPCQPTGVLRKNRNRLGGERRDSHVPAMLKDAFMPIGRDAGRFLYQLARCRPAQVIVEFGMSFGLSTICLAAAVKDSGTGRVITTEMEPTKVRRATEHLQEAGLLDYVEIREGDALNTLTKIDGPIDLVFLTAGRTFICRFCDSWNQICAQGLSLWPTI
jgi:predicted O-methyltransferase YrrM